MKKSKLLFVSLLSSVMVLTACGGGSGNESKASEPTSASGSSVSTDAGSSVTSISSVSSQNSQPAPSSTPSSAPSSVTSSSARPSSSTQATYKVNVTQNNLVTVNIENPVNPNAVRKGDMVIFTVTKKDAEVEISDVKATYKVNNVDTNVQISQNAGKYTFTMPEGDVTITVVANAKEYTITNNNNPKAQVIMSDHTNGKAHKGETVKFSVAKANDVNLTSVKVMQGTAEVTSSLNSGVYSFTMPGGDVVITVTTEGIKYTVSTDNNQNVNFALSGGKQEYAQGETVTFTATAKAGYELTGVTVKKGTENVAVGKNGNTYSFTMPNGNVTIGFTTVAVHNVTLNADANSRIELTNQKTTYKQGETVSFRVVITNDAFELDEVKVLNGSAAVTTSNSSGTYSFTMPNASVTIAVTTKAKSSGGSQSESLAGMKFACDYDIYSYGVDYTFYLTVMFVDDTTFNWYLTYVYYEEEWVNPYTPKDNIAIKTTTLGLTSYGSGSSVPSGVQGEYMKTGEDGREYTYNAETGVITATMKPLQSVGTFTFNVNKDTSGNIVSIRMNESLSNSDQMYNTSNRVLRKK